MNNIFQYQMVMAWVRSLLHDGIITQREYTKIDTKIAKRYGVSSSSIFSEFLDFQAVQSEYGSRKILGW